MTAIKTKDEILLSNGISENSPENILTRRRKLSVLQCRKGLQILMEGKDEHGVLVLLS
jgi:hypothetical protein